MPTAVPTPAGSRRWDGKLGLFALLVATLVLIVMPALLVLASVGRELLSPAPTPPASPMVPWRLLGVTLLYSGGVGLLATLLAIPAAIVIRGRGWRWGVWVCTPMLLPSYLAYAGWGLLRAPRTILGDAIERAAQAGATWLPTAVGEALAIGGLALWSWPIAAVLLSLHWSRVDAGALDALVLDAKGSRRWLSLARMGAPGALVAFAAATLVMLGSPVPFHLAQVPTISMEVWRRLMEEPLPARAWASALPMTCVVIAGVFAFARSALAAPASSLESPTSLGTRASGPVARSWAALVALAALFACSLLAPLALFLLAIHEWSSVPVTLHSLRPAIVNSGLVCFVVTAVGLAMAVASWRAFSSFGAGIRGLARMCLLAFLVAGVLPGVLVGSALAACLSLVDSRRLIADTSLAVAMGHLARFLFVPILAGWWLASTEPADARDLRRVEGVGGLSGYFAGIFPNQLPALIGVAAILTALSLHEIESAIMLTPPGGGGLAHRILGFLHYSKMEDLSVASAGLALVAIALAILVGLLGGRWGKMSS